MHYRFQDGWLLFVDVFIDMCLSHSPSSSFSAALFNIVTWKNDQSGPHTNRNCEIVVSTNDRWHKGQINITHTHTRTALMCAFYAICQRTSFDLLLHLSHLEIRNASDYINKWKVLSLVQCVTYDMLSLCNGWKLWLICCEDCVWSHSLIYVLCAMCGILP